jgi:SAM-dependent methyltransferase/uncharacterized protein YbaR (Trm112 family)
MSNPLLDNAQLLNLLRCPVCNSSDITVEERGLMCTGCASCFPLAGCRPILLRNDNPLFSITDYFDAMPEGRARHCGLTRYVPSPSVNLASSRVLNHLRMLLDANGMRNILVIGAGRQRAWLDPLLRAVKPHNVVYSDIDSSADVDLFCDGHDLPFIDGAFDAVVTTAVLEHVLYPERVAAEIARVVKPGGLLYSELPFMQQVHEGAYDFTRYTLSGHRRLFNQFAQIDAGMVAGPATAFVWALENLILAFVSRQAIRKPAKAAVRIMFSWIKYLDYLLANRPEAMDGASCTYFIGKKNEERTPDSEIIARYTGANPFRHV